MRSRFEQRVAGHLHYHGVPYDYEAISFEYEEPLRKNRASCLDCGGSNLVRQGWYTPDFYIPRSGYFIETKGRWTAQDRRKMVAVINAHPDDKFAMCFMRDNKIHRRSDTTYSQWCETHGIEWAIGWPKDEWL